MGNTLPASPPLDQLYWNKKAYTLPSERTTYGENKNHWENIKIMRYADVLLMAAEAANEDGNSGLAATYLEEVRKRARGANNSILPIVSGGQTTLRTAIKQERRIERRGKAVRSSGGGRRICIVAWWGARRGSRSTCTRAAI